MVFARLVCVCYVEEETADARPYNRKPGKQTAPKIMPLLKCWRQSHSKISTMLEKAKASDVDTNVGHHITNVFFLIIRGV